METMEGNEWTRFIKGRDCRMGVYLLEEEEEHEKELVLKISDLLRALRRHGSPECWSKDVWIGGERERERKSRTRSLTMRD